MSDNFRHRRAGVMMAAVMAGLSVTSVAAGVVPTVAVAAEASDYVGTWTNEANNQVGYVSARTYGLTLDDDGTGTCTMSGQPIGVTYDAAAGTITFPTTDDAPLSGTYQLTAQDGKLALRLSDTQTLSFARGEGGQAGSVSDSGAVTPGGEAQTDGSGTGAAGGSGTDAQGGEAQTDASGNTVAPPTVEPDYDEGGLASDTTRTDGSSATDDTSDPGSTSVSIGSATNGSAGTDGAGGGSGSGSADDPNVTSEVPVDDSGSSRADMNTAVAGTAGVALVAAAVAAGVAAHNHGKARKDSPDKTKEDKNE